MATQAIRFVATPGQTITLDVVDISNDSLKQSALVCTESTNDKGSYVTANFTDTLTGRHSIIKRISGTPIGKDYVTMANANGTYQSDEYKLLVAGVDSAVTAATQATAAADQTNIDADGFDLEESMRLALAALVGKSTATPTSYVARAADDSKNRITATTTADGSRTLVTKDAS
jgi:hypothetical protein